MSGPLEKVRVLDLTHTLAGLCCTMFLGDLGAEVIRVEPKEEGGLKGVGARRPSSWRVGNIDMRFIFLNRNKKSLTLNLKTAKGKEIFFKLVQKSDIVVDNFRPAVLERLGIEYAKLKEKNPDIISCSISGFNPEGPYSEVPAFDHIAQALSGLMSLNKEPDRDPIILSFYASDLSSALFATIGIVSALYQRVGTREGQKVTVSLLGTDIFLLFYEGVAYLNSGILPQPTGARGRTPTFGIFKTKDIPISIAASTEGQYQSLCRVVGEDRLITDPRFAARTKRVENMRLLDDMIEARLKENNSSYWIEALEKADVPVARINNMSEAFSDPHIKAEDAVAEIIYQGKKLKVLRVPIKMSKFVDRLHNPPPELGEHSEAVLKELLSLSKKEVEELKKEGIV